MSVWFCIPSARPPEEAEPVLKQWRERGYKIAIMRDRHDWGCLPYDRIFVDPDGYPGYARAVNAIIKDVCYMDTEADWFVTGGDDVLPDPKKSAEEIARECTAHFWNDYELTYPPSRPAWGNDAYFSDDAYNRIGTFGVCQPTGDDWSDHQGRMIERIAGSPWIGREFARRINQGNGPLWPEYFHNWADEELQCVATELGVFWQRPDLTHYHDNPMRHGKPRAPHLKGVDADYHAKKPLFDSRKAAGFPGSEPL